MEIWLLIILVYLLIGAVVSYREREYLAISIVFWALILVAKLILEIRDVIKNFFER